MPKVTFMIGFMLVVFTTSTVHAQPTVVSRDSVRALALNANLDVIIAHSKAMQADELRSSAVDLGPLSITWMGGQYNAPDFDNSFSIEQGIPWPGKLMANSSLFDAQATEAELESHWTRRTVLASVERTMDRIAYARELIAILDRLDSVMSRSVSVVRTRQTVGDATELERLFQEGRLSELKAQRSQYQAELRNAETNLHVLCGDAFVTIPDTVLQRRKRPADTLLSPSVSARYEQRLLVAKAQHDVSKNSWWPDFTVGYSNQSLIGTKLHTGRITDGSDRFQYVTIGMSVPLWFGPVQAKQAQTALDVQLAEKETQRRVDHAEHERENLQRTIAALVITLDHYDGPARHESLTLVEHGSRAYEAGQIGWVELQQSLQRAITINLSRLETLQEYNDAVIQLNLLTGKQP